MQVYTKTDDNKPNLDDYRDRNGFLTVDGLQVGIKITDARLRFGHLDLLITPLTGSGKRWVEQHRIELEEAKAVVETPSHTGTFTTDSF